MTAAPAMGARSRTVLVCALAVWLTAALFVVLQPIPHLGNDSIDALSSLARAVGLGAVVTPDVAGFVLNVALFVPPTVLASVLLRDVPAVGWVAAAFVASGLVELAQLALPDRTASALDVLANTAGAAIGVGLVARLRPTAPMPVVEPNATTGSGQFHGEQE